MRGTRAGGWIAGAVVAILAIFAGTWFFVAGPRFESAALTLAEAESNQVQNDLLRAHLAKLRADAENLDVYKTELTALRKQIPADADLTAYTRIVEQIASANSVTVITLSPGPAQTVVAVGDPGVAPAAPVPEPAPVEETEAIDPAADVAEPVAPAPLGPEQVEGFVSIPVTLQVAGTYANVAAFLEALQTGTERLFLITQLDSAAMEASEATPSRPALADGDLEVTVQGLAYVLVSPESATVTEGEQVEVAPVPLPTTDRNPFAPLPGTEGGED